MAYSTQAMVQTAVGGSRNLIELADLEETFAADAGAGMALAVADAIEAADSIIDSYLAKQVAVPVNPVPRTIANLSASMAVRILRSNRYKGQAIKEDLDADIEDRKWLDKIAKGELSLGVDPPPTKASTRIDKAAARDSSLITSSEKLKSFI
jgi:phage gp36-like protein